MSITIRSLDKSERKSFNVYQNQLLFDLDDGKCFLLIYQESLGQYHWLDIQMNAIHPGMTNKKTGLNESEYEAIENAIVYADDVGEDYAFWYKDERGCTNWILAEEWLNPSKKWARFNLQECGVQPY